MAALKELIDVREAERRETPDYASVLFDKQLEAFRDPRKVKALLCGRRAGKSVLLAVMLLVAAEQNPGSLSLYITLTARNARLIIWPTLKWLCEMFNAGASFNENELTVTLPNQSKILCGGCKDRAEIEKYRGPYYAICVVDECGSFPPFLAELYRDVLRPATIDLDAPIVFAGTPGLVWTGFWYDMTGPDPRIKVPVYRWTLWDNPTIPNAGQIADDIKEENGWGDDHPTWRREYLGLWSQDDDAVMFPWNPDDSRSSLPEEHGWNYVLGIDVGQVDATAFCVWASHRNYEEDFIVETWKESGMLVDQLAADVRMYMRKYENMTVVMDTGGMGKQHSEELRRRYAIPVYPADKKEKESAIRVLRDRVRARRVLILDGPRNDAIRDEWAVCRWNDKRTDFQDGLEDHAAHAALYGHRMLRNYLYEQKETPVLPGTEAFYAEEEKRIVESLKRRYSEREDGRPSWDR